MSITNEEATELLKDINGHLADAANLMTHLSENGVTVVEVDNDHVNKTFSSRQVYSHTLHGHCLRFEPAIKINGSIAL